MSESKTIKAAVDLINARFTFSESGHYLLKNSNNEEYVCHCIGELHRALVAEGHMPDPKPVDKEQLLRYK